MTSLPGILKRLHLMWRLLLKPRTAPGAKVAALIAVLYLLFPLDFLPDLVPILGWLDDGAFIAAALAILNQALTRYQQSQAGAEQEPPHTTHEALPSPPRDDPP